MREATGRRVYEEDATCIALMRWAAHKRLPEWDTFLPGERLSDYMIHIPNGGRRNKREAGRLKKMGVKPGVSDYMIPIACGMYHGMWLEIKRKDGRVSPAQKDWMEKMARQRRYVAVAYSLQEAIDKIEHYFSQQAVATI